MPDAGYPFHMTTYACPEFAATGLELQIIELQAQRDTAQREGWTAEAEAHEAEIGRLWSELADLVDAFPQVAA